MRGAWMMGLNAHDVGSAAAARITSATTDRPILFNHRRIKKPPFSESASGSGRTSHYNGDQRGNPGPVWMIRFSIPIIPPFSIGKSGGI